MRDTKPRRLVHPRGTTLRLLHREAGRTVSDATIPQRRKRQPVAEAPQPAAPAQSVRFSGPYLIGGTGLRPDAGSIVRVSGSRMNDGQFEVIAADAEWLEVKPWINDEAPSLAIVTLETAA